MIPLPWQRVQQLTDQAKKQVPHQDRDTPAVPRVGVFYNHRAMDRLKTKVCEAILALRRLGAPVVADADWCEQARGYVEVMPEARMVVSCDVGVVLGGDGTLLGVGRAAADADLPLLGVKLGSFGFLTGTSQESLDLVMDRLVEGFYASTRHLVLHVELENEGGEAISCTAVNEVFLTSRQQGRLLDIAFRIDDAPPLDFRADGLIVASPLGSTGHSLSAGGPILVPSVQGLVLTPVCAHTLASRPLVVPEQSCVRMSARVPGERIRVIIDGQVAFDPTPGSVVTVRRHPTGLRLLNEPRRHFTESIRRKFYLGQTQ